MFTSNHLCTCHRHPFFFVIIISYKEILFFDLDGFTMLTADESATSISASGGSGDYEESEYLYIKMSQGKKYDLKIEHFDDMILDNSF